MALRTVPIMVEIGNRGKESSAWLINYTNPTGLVAEAIGGKTSKNKAHSHLRMSQWCFKISGFAPQGYPLNVCSSTILALTILPGQDIFSPRCRRIAQSKTSPGTY